MRSDADILWTLARHLSKHGTDAFAHDDEGDAEVLRAATLLEQLSREPLYGQVRRLLSRPGS